MGGPRSGRPYGCEQCGQMQGAREAWGRTLTWGGGRGGGGVLSVMQFFAAVLAVRQTRKLEWNGQPRSRAAGGRGTPSTWTVGAWAAGRSCSTAAEPRILSAAGMQGDSVAQPCRVPAWLTPRRGSAQYREHVPLALPLGLTQRKETQQSEEFLQVTPSSPQKQAVEPAGKRFKGRWCVGGWVG